MEELVLSAPVVVPASTTDRYRVVALTLNLEAASTPSSAPGLILIDLRDNLGVRSSYRYEGQTATDMIKFLNTANLTTKSMHKRILERLSADGLLVGTVTGTPDA
jgi:hypothetical protein